RARHRELSAQRTNARRGSNPWRRSPAADGCRHRIATARCAGRSNRCDAGAAQRVTDSERQLGVEQDQPRIRDERRGILAKRRTAHHRNRILKIIVVPEIRKVAANLKLQILVDRDLLHQTQVPVLERWSAEGVPSEIAAPGHGVRKYSVWSERSGN